VLKILFPKRFPIKRLFSLCAILIFAAMSSDAAPKRAPQKSTSKAKPKQKPAPKAVKPAPTKGVLETGVLITPITRNETPAKIAFALARGGKALVPIVVSQNASDNTRALASELQNCLQRMTGAIFDITVGDGSEGIVLGTANEFPTPALDKALEIRHVYDGKEAFAIRTREKKVLLLGATGKGLSHAVFRFLEEMGCR